MIERATRVVSMLGGITSAVLCMWLAALIFPVLFFFPRFGILSVLFFLDSTTAAHIVLSVWCRETVPRLWVALLAVPNLYVAVQSGHDGDLVQLEVASYLFLATAVAAIATDILTSPKHLERGL